jgi:hypothetical protein
LPTAWGIGQGRRQNADWDEEGHSAEEVRQVTEYIWRHRERERKKKEGELFEGGTQ